MTCGDGKGAARIIATNKFATIQKIAIATNKFATSQKIRIATNKFTLVWKVRIATTNTLPTARKVHFADDKCLVYHLKEFGFFTRQKKLIMIYSTLSGVRVRMRVDTFVNQSLLRSKWIWLVAQLVQQCAGVTHDWFPIYSQRTCCYALPRTADRLNWKRSLISPAPQKSGGPG